MTKRDKCRGCYNEDYHHGLGGAKKCWSFDRARVVKRAFVHVDQVPPWHNRLEATLSCHIRQRHVAIQPGHPQLKKTKEVLPL